MSVNASAKVRFLRMAPRKVRLVADMVRGEKVSDALSTLQFTNRYAANPLRKLLKSALANFSNLEGNEDVSVDDVVIKDLQVNEGPTMKRFRPRAMGRATKILKRSSHVTVIVGEDSVVEE